MKIIHKSAKEGITKFRINRGLRNLEGIILSNHQQNK